MNWYRIMSVLAFIAWMYGAIEVWTGDWNPSTFLIGLAFTVVALNELMDALRGRRPA